jgi:hypothetical protein
VRLATAVVLGGVVLLLPLLCGGWVERAGLGLVRLAGSFVLAVFGVIPFDGFESLLRALVTGLVAPVR